MNALSMKFFGKFAVCDGLGEPLPISGKKNQALLLFLAVGPSPPHTRDQLMTLLWGDREDAHARQSLRQSLTRLRKDLGPDGATALLTDGDFVNLDQAVVRTDVAEFRRLAAEGTQEAQSEAADIYSGLLAAGLDIREGEFEAWLADERNKFKDLACRVLHRLASAQAAGRQPETAIATARRLIDLDPLFEPGHRLLMRGLTRSGQRAAALKQYRACKEVLRRELDAAPGEKTQGLYRSILSEFEFSASERREGGDGHAKMASIAVLPFENLSGDPEQGYFANGIAEDITTALLRFRWFLVISRNSSAAFKNHGEGLDARRVAEELGADYLVEGAVRKAGGRVRVSIELIDAATATDIWAEHYDRDLEDIFGVQDEITEMIVARIEPELGAVERRRVRGKSARSLNAWDCYHLGLSNLYKFNREGIIESERLFRRVIEIDPDFAEAYARLAYAILMNMVYFDAGPTQDRLDEALTAAKRAVALDDQDAVAHFAVGRVHLARGEYELSITELRTAIDLNPCLAQAHCGLGDSLAYSGALEESIPAFEEAIRLSPHDPYRWGFMTYRALAHLFLKEHAEAADWARKAAMVPNSQYWSNAHLVAALGHLERSAETKAALADLLRLKPEFSVDFARTHLFYIKDPEQLGHYLDGLQKAGLPD